MGMGVWANCFIVRMYEQAALKVVVLARFFLKTIDSCNEKTLNK
jgi:hypothetical protein